MTLLLTVPEAAALLRLSKGKVYQLIGRGDLASVKIDGARRVRRVDLELYVARLQNAGGSAVPWPAPGQERGRR